MEREVKKFSPAIFAAALICFFLPFVNVSCQGEKIASFTGVRLVTGTTVEQPSLFGQKENKKVDSEPLAALAFLCGVAGLGLSFLQKKKSAIAPALIGGTGVILLLLLKSKLDSDVLRQGQGMLRLEYGAGFWLAFLFYVSAAAVNGFLFARSKKEVAEVPIPKERIAPASPVACCPRCQAEVKDGMRFCQICGFKLIEEPKIEPKPVEEKRVAAVLCRKCRAPVAPGLKFCEACGAPLAATGKRWVAAVVSLLFVIGLGTAGWFGYRYFRQRQAESSTVVLTILSSPPECQVFLDEQPRNQTDSMGQLVLSNLQPGRHTITLRREGYLESSREVELSSSMTLSIQLSQVPPVTLRVMTVPGSDVYLDNQQVGAADVQGQMVIPNLRQGSHTVRVSRGGYQDWTQTITLDSDQTLNLPLVPVTLPPVTLRVMTVPGSDVYLDNQQVGTADVQGQIVIPNVRQGSHTVRVNRGGYQDRTQTITLDSDQTLNLPLMPVTLPPVTLTVTTLPGSDVYLDSQPFGTTDPSGRMVIPNVKQGSHSVKVRREAYEDWTQVITLNSDSTVNAPLTRLSYEKRLQVARNYTTTGNTGQAVSVLQGLVAEAPNRFEAYEMLGNIYYNQNQFSQAREMMRQAIQRGGRAEFSVTHDHVGGPSPVDLTNKEWRDYCRGELIITSGRLQFRTSVPNDEFSVSKEYIREAKMNAMVGSQIAAFHIKLKSGSVERTFNFAPRTKEAGESQLILALISAFVQ
jgi:hypothetical protein